VVISDLIKTQVFKVGGAEKSQIAFALLLWKQSCY